MHDYDPAFDALMIREGIDYDDPHDTAHQGRDDDLITRYGITPAEQLAPGGDESKRELYGLYPGFSRENAKSYYYGEHWKPLVRQLSGDTHAAALWCLLDVSVHSGTGTARRYLKQYGLYLPKADDLDSAREWFGGFCDRRLLRYERITRKRLAEAADQDETEARWRHCRGWSARLLKLSKSLYFNGPLSGGMDDLESDADQTIVLKPAQPAERPAPMVEPVQLPPIVVTEAVKPNPKPAPKPPASKWQRWLKVAGVAATAAGVSAAAPVASVIEGAAPIIDAVANGASWKDAVLGGLAGLFIFDRDKKKNG